jgi:hypothetical protein
LIVEVTRMFSTSNRIDELFAELTEMISNDNLIVEDDISPFIEGFTWRDTNCTPPIPADDAFWLEDNDYMSSLDMMSDAFEAALRLGQAHPAGTPIIMVQLDFGGQHGEQSLLFLFGDEEKWYAKLKAEFDRRFVVAQTMAS